MNWCALCQSKHDGPCKTFPLDRRIAADGWLQKKLGEGFEVMLEIMTQYHLMGGTLDLTPAGLRPQKYTKVAMREYQRRRRAKLREAP